MPAESRKVKSSLSSGVKVSTGGAFGRPATKTVRRFTQGRARRAEASKLQLEQISGTLSAYSRIKLFSDLKAGLSFQDRDALLDMQSADDNVAGMDIDRGPWSTLPPGEEAMFTSHAGGKEELC